MLHALLGKEVPDPHSVIRASMRKKTIRGRGPQSDTPHTLRRGDPRVPHSARRGRSLWSVKGIGCPPFQYTVDDLQQFVSPRRTAPPLSSAAAHSFRGPGHIASLLDASVRPGEFRQQELDQVIAIALQFALVACVSGLMGRRGQSRVGAESIDRGKALDRAEESRQCDRSELSDPWDCREELCLLRDHEDAVDLGVQFLTPGQEEVDRLEGAVHSRDSQLADFFSTANGLEAALPIRNPSIDQLPVAVIHESPDLPSIEQSIPNQVAHLANLGRWRIDGGKGVESEERGQSLRVDAVGLDRGLRDKPGLQGIREGGCGSCGLHGLEVAFPHRARLHCDSLVITGQPLQVLSEFLSGRTERGLVQLISFSIENGGHYALSVDVQPDECCLPHAAPHSRRQEAPPLRVPPHRAGLNMSTLRSSIERARPS